MAIETEDDDQVSLGTVKVKKTITLLRSPKATFVSLVPNGANQRPFRVLKSDEDVFKAAKKKKVVYRTTNHVVHVGRRLSSRGGLPLYATHKKTGKKTRIGQVQTTGKFAQVHHSIGGGTEDWKVAGTMKGAAKALLLSHTRIAKKKAAFKTATSAKKSKPKKTKKAKVSRGVNKKAVSSLLSQASRTLSGMKIRKAYKNKPYVDSITHSPMHGLVDPHKGSIRHFSSRGAAIRAKNKMKKVRKLDLSVNELISNGGNKAPTIKRIFQKKRVPKGIFVTLTKSIKAEGHKIVAFRNDGVVFKHCDTGKLIVRKGFLSAAKRIGGKLGRALVSGTKHVVVTAGRLARKAKVLHAKRKSKDAKAARAVLSKLPESHKARIRNKLHSMVLEHTMETIDRSHRRGAKAPALKNKKILAGLHEYESALGPVRSTAKTKKRKPKGMAIVKPKAKAAPKKKKAKAKASNIVPFKKTKTKAKAVKKPKTKVSTKKKKAPAAASHSHEEEGGFGAFLTQRHAA